MAKQTVALNARSGWLLSAMYSFNDPAENAGFLLEMKGLSTNETIRDSSSRNNAKSFVFFESCHQILDGWCPHVDCRKAPGIRMLFYYHPYRTSISLPVGRNSLCNLAVGPTTPRGWTDIATRISFFLLLLSSFFPVLMHQTQV